MDIIKRNALKDQHFTVNGIGTAVLQITDRQGDVYTISDGKNAADVKIVGVYSGSHPATFGATFGYTAIPQTSPLRIFDIHTFARKIPLDPTEPEFVASRLPLRSLDFEVIDDYKINPPGISGPEISADTETEASRKALDAFTEHCLELKFKDGAPVCTPSGLSFRVHVVPRHEGATGCVRLFLVDPKYGNGVARATMALDDGADAYESGIAAGLNHQYLQMYCSTCLRRDCPLGEIECVYRTKDDETHKRMLITSDVAVKACVFQGNLREVIKKMLQHAFSMKLCSCKQWFAIEGNALCTSCLAAIAVGVADSCTVCHEPAAKRTRCCKQALHTACHAHHTEHAPPGREAKCPTCRAAPYGFD